ncbi:hypothetical protein PVK06_043750 [Gossypium arboreum]|uniref:Uncharacterized protein n=1 Tax=Gossypium arboreum TaxID=29729 RepID=A0ABR0MPG9_GOSAR|nr:hypothetical protein PVK06_043750 [Gossypium arboreum]
MSQIESSCNERRDFTNPKLPTEQKGEPSQHLGYGDAGVGFPQMANATAIATVLEEGSRAGENVIGTSLSVPQVPISKSENGYGDGGVEVAGSFAQAENQVLQLGSDVQGPSKTQEQGEPDAGISAVSTTQKMSGTQVRQAISGINDRCTMMGKVSPNEYPLSGVSYVPEESVVLLENGALFLFDLASCVNWLKLNGYVRKTKIEMLNPYAIVKDQFLASSTAGAEGFQFVLASQSLLLLCDMCKPMVPLLCWVHHLDNPCFIDVIRLSELRSQLGMIHISGQLNQPDDSLVGPILPLPILLTLHKFRNGCPDSDKMCGFSLNAEFGLRFNKVMRVAAEMVVLDSSFLNNDETISLANDKDEIVGLELFDDLCPIELKFDDVPVMNFELMDALCLIEEWVFMVILWKIQVLFLTLILNKNHFEVEVIVMGQNEDSVTKKQNIVFGFTETMRRGPNEMKRFIQLILKDFVDTKGKPDQGCKTIEQ